MSSQGRYNRTQLAPPTLRDASGRYRSLQLVRKGVLASLPFICWPALGAPGDVMDRSQAPQASIEAPSQPIPPGVEPLVLHTRRMAESRPGARDWQPVEKTVRWDPTKTAVILIDFWDSHHDHYKAINVDMMADRLNRLCHYVRDRGGVILHGPSGVTSYYNGSVMREMMETQPPHNLPQGVDIQPWINPMPWELDFYDGMERGISETRNNWPLWTRQHPGIQIMPEDGVSENPQEYYNLFMDRGITNVIMTGVHYNWCVMGRNYGVRQWVRLGWNIVLVRDLTDTGIGVGDRVKIDGVEGHTMSHDRANDYMTRHIERFWCPTIEANDLLEDPTPPPALFIDNEFDDDDIYYDYHGLQEFSRGGGMYNMSEDNDWRQNALARAHSRGAREFAGRLILEALPEGRTGAAISRAIFGHDDAFCPRGVEIRWTIDRLENFGPSQPGNGLCLGVIEADGPLGTPAPAALDTPQIYVTLRETGDGPGGEICVNTPDGGCAKPIDGTAFTFERWDPSTPLGLVLALDRSGLRVVFDAPLKGGDWEVFAPLPEALANAEKLNATAGLNGAEGARAYLDCLTVRRRD